MRVRPPPGGCARGHQPTAQSSGCRKERSSVPSTIDNFRLDAHQFSIDLLLTHLAYQSSACDRPLRTGPVGETADACQCRSRHSALASRDAAAVDRAHGRLLVADAAFALSVPETKAGALAKLAHVVRHLAAAVVDAGPSAAAGLQLAARLVRQSARQLRAMDPAAMRTLRQARAALVSVDEAVAETSGFLAHLDGTLTGLSRPRVAAERRG
jgi:hypothetical protein